MIDLNKILDFISGDEIVISIYNDHIHIQMISTANKITTMILRHNRLHNFLNVSLSSSKSYIIIGKINFQLYIELLYMIEDKFINNLNIIFHNQLNNIFRESKYLEYKRNKNLNKIFNND